MYYIYRITNNINGKTYIGQHWYNNGKINTRAFECPKGFKQGIIRG